MHTPPKNIPQFLNFSSMTTTDRIGEALAELELQEAPNYKRTAEGYDFHRTTLSRRHRGVCGSIKEARELQSLLSSQQQIALVNHINKLSEAGIPPTPAMVRVFAFEICQKWPGEQWVSRFVKTHKATLKSAYLSGFDLKRKKADNYYMIKKYFELVCILFIIIYCTYNIDR
jgi:hypothetical protein